MDIENKSKISRKELIELNTLANKCGYFYNAYLEKGVSINNGYNCRHPKQEEFEDINGVKIGNCYSFSCPLAYKADREDCEKFGETVCQGCNYEDDCELDMMVVEYDDDGIILLTQL